VRGDCFELAPKLAGTVDLIVCDPPYGEILDEPWDHECYGRLGKLVESLLVPRGTAYVFGGVGTYKNRPFLRWLSEVEDETNLRLHNLITWGKKRAYGTSSNFLFTREECAMLVKGDKPKTFNIPLLDKLRGYAGYDKKYPAKSAYLRRTNVWSDVTELFRGKIHPAEKPSKLAEIMIRTSSNPGDLVVDLFAGSGSTGVAALAVGDRRCILFEKSDCAMHDFGSNLTALRQESIKARKAAPGISLEASRDQARRAMTGQK
jgi:DNA modification methylase